MTDSKNDNCEGDGSYKKITVKIHILAGKKDVIVTVDKSEKMHKLFGEKNSTLKIFEDSGHACIYDYPDEVTAEIKKFVKD